MANLQVRLGRLSLKNPVLVASGTFGYVREMAGFVRLERLGGVIPKTVTYRPRAGNPTPRTVETAQGRTVWRGGAASCVSILVVLESAFTPLPFRRLIPNKQPPFPLANRSAQSLERLSRGHLRDRLEARAEQLRMI